MERLSLSVIHITSNEMLGDQDVSGHIGGAILRNEV